MCRVLPWVVSNYKLDELSSVQELRRNIALLFRKHSHVTAPGVRRWACCCSCLAAIGSDGRHLAYDILLDPVAVPACDCTVINLHAGG